MASDSLYMNIALWLTGRLDSRIGAPEPVSAPTLPRYTTEEKNLLLSSIRKERGVL